jgi:hypothetical protein
MDENKYRRLSIADELTTWGDALPRVLIKIDEVRGASNITTAQAATVESIAYGIGTVIQGLGEAIYAEDYDGLIAILARLREKIVIANALIDRLLQSTAEPIVNRRLKPIKRQNGI